MTTPGTSTGDDQKVRVFAVEVARLMADRHCEDVRLLDVRGLSQVCDYVLLGSGTSDRQMKSLAEELSDFGRDQSQPVFRTDSDAAVTWIVVDFVALVAHIFEPGQRAFYDLEGLWSDAPLVPWERAGLAANE
ncbi:MAG: ribosome silencing factor [Planctomycetota bacterium]|jgi:ribosome-associated protein